jgi:CHAD domain-containing protein
MERSLARLAALPRPASSAPAEALHAFRIAVKRARYAAEAFAPAFGRPVTRFREALVALQDALGGLQDAHVIAAALEPLVTEAERDRPDGAAARRAAEGIAEGLSARASALRAGLDARVEAALGRAALRDLHDHLAKRTVRAVADARR